MTEPKMRSIIERLTNRKPLQQLSSGLIWDELLDRQIAVLWTPDEQDMNKLALQSALHLWNDSLDRSHEISQIIMNATGSYLHGIMHRMEGDYSNAKYWFRQTGYHSAMKQLHSAAVNWLTKESSLSENRDGEADVILSNIAQEERWNPLLMVDAIRSQESGNGSPYAREMLEKLQRMEMVYIIRYCEANL